MSTTKERQELKTMRKDLNKLIERVAYLDASGRSMAAHLDKGSSYWWDGLKRIEKLERHPLLRATKPSKKK